MLYRTVGATAAVALAAAWWLNDRERRRKILSAAQAAAAPELNVAEVQKAAPAKADDAPDVPEEPLTDPSIRTRPAPDDAPDVPEEPLTDPSIRTRPAPDDAPDVPEEPLTDPSIRTRPAPVATSPPPPFRPLNVPAGSARSAEEVREMQAKINRANREVITAWETREWEKARARLDAKKAVIAAQEADAAHESVAEKSRKLIEWRRQAMEQTLAAEARADAEAAAKSAATAAAAVRLTLSAADGRSVALSIDFDDEQPSAAPKPSAPRALPRAAARQSIASHRPALESEEAPALSEEERVAAELRRWPSPPTGTSSELVAHTWPLYLDVAPWLDEMASRYSFGGADEVLRHLIFAANGETAQVKKLIFLIVRCLHCHSGARAGSIPKRERELRLFGFQHAWLTAVQARSNHPSIEKTVRIVCDYYRKLTSDKPAAEAELFWRNRGDVTAGRKAQSFHGPTHTFFLC